LLEQNTLYPFVLEKNGLITYCYIMLSKSNNFQSARQQRVLILSYLPKVHFSLVSSSLEEDNFFKLAYKIVAWLQNIASRLYIILKVFIKL